MLVPDWIYYRIPQIWLIMGVAFLLLGLAAGPEYQNFYAHIALGAVCILRSWQVYGRRRKINRRNRMTVLTKTQKLDGDSLVEPAGE